MATHVFRSYRPGPYPHKGKGVCVCAIYDNNISPSLLMIIIKLLSYVSYKSDTLMISPNGYPASVNKTVSKVVFQGG